MTTSLTDLTRTSLQEDALAVFGIPSGHVRQVSGIPLAATETAGTLNLTLSSNVWLLVGEVANNETETSEAAFQFVLPAEYVSGGDVKVRIKHRAHGAGTLGASTTDIEVFKQDGNGAVGSDLCTTAAATMLDDTWTTTDFIVTSTGLVAGDILNVVLTTVVLETATADITAEIDGIAMLLDVKG